MPAIRPHSTDTVDRPWDGPGNVARLRNDAEPEYYRRMFAWYDPEGNPSAKSTYKFPHHEVDGEGNIGPANVRGCINGIAVLNGARGGADIPEEDRRAVWRHLARHLEDAGMEPPELRSRTAVEVRSFQLEGIEVRAAEEGRSRKLVGYAAVFDQISEDLGGFREVIRRGAFRKTLQEADVRALWNHDENFVLGRTKSGTLRLEEDERGLKIEIDPPDTQWARDLLVSIERGDVDQMSFAFVPVKDNWTEGRDGKPLRELLEVRLFDVSPVTWPAYPQTSIQVRSWQQWLERLHPSMLTDEDRELLRRILRRLETWDTTADGASAPPADEPPPAGHSAEEALRRRRLRLRELELITKL